MQFDFSHLEEYHYKYFKGIQWLHIFHHNISGRVYFANESEALHCHEEQKYSILYLVNDDMKVSNKYEFLLQYGSSETKYNRWRQDKNPLNQTEENVLEADGFEAIHLDYNSTGLPFKGLAKTSITYNYPLHNITNYISCLLNGGFNDQNWYFAIAQYKVYTVEWEEKIPAGSADGEQSVDLWIRLPKNSNTFFDKQKFMNFRLYILVFLMAK